MDVGRGGRWVGGGQVHEDTRTALRKAKDSIQRVSSNPLSHTHTAMLWGRR